MKSLLQTSLDTLIRMNISSYAELSLTLPWQEIILKSGIPITPLYYDIASMTKTILSTITLQAVRDGKLSFDTNAQDFLPYLPFPVSIDELLRHTSGVNILNKFDKSKDYSKAEIESFIKHPDNIIKTWFKEYCNLNYIYIWDVLEAIFQTSLTNLVQRFLKNYDLEMTYCPLKNGIKSEHISPTERSAGLVHDPLTYYLQGASWAAWLFATHSALHQFWKLWMENAFEIPTSVYQEEFQSEEVTDFYHENGFPNPLQDSLSPVYLDLYGRCWRKGRYSPDLVEFSGHTWPSLILSKKRSWVLSLSCNICQSSNPPERRKAYMKWKRELIANIQTWKI